MSGQEAIAEIRAQGAEIRAQEAKTHALLRETRAHLIETRAEVRAEIAEIALGVEANTARPDAVGWNVTATLGLVVGRVAGGLFHWITGRWGNQRSIRSQSSGEESTV